MPKIPQAQVQQGTPSLPVPGVPGVIPGAQGEAVAQGFGSLAASIASIAIEQKQRSDKERADKTYQELHSWALQGINAVKRDREWRGSSGKFMDSYYSKMNEMSEGLNQQQREMFSDGAAKLGLSFQAQMLDYEESRRKLADEATRDAQTANWSATLTSFMNHDLFPQNQRLFEEWVSGRPDYERDALRRAVYSNAMDAALRRYLDAGDTEGAQKILKLDYELMPPGEDGSRPQVLDPKYRARIEGEIESKKRVGQTYSAVEGVISKYQYDSFDRFRDPATIKAIEGELLALPDSIKESGWQHWERRRNEIQARYELDQDNATDQAAAGIRNGDYSYENIPSSVGSRIWDDRAWSTLKGIQDNLDSDRSGNGHPKITDWKSQAVTNAMNATDAEALAAIPYAEVIALAPLMDEGSFEGFLREWRGAKNQLSKDTDKAKAQTRTMIRSLWSSGARLSYNFTDNEKAALALNDILKRAEGMVTTEPLTEEQARQVMDQMFLENAKESKWNLYEVDIPIYSIKEKSIAAALRSSGGGTSDLPDNYQKFIVENWDTQQMRDLVKYLVGANSLNIGATISADGEVFDVSVPQSVLLNPVDQMSGTIAKRIFSAYVMWSRGKGPRTSYEGKDFARSVEEFTRLKAEVEGQYLKKGETPKEIPAPQETAPEPQAVPPPEEEPVGREISQADLDEASKELAANGVINAPADMLLAWIKLKREQGADANWLDIGGAI